MDIDNKNFLDNPIEKFKVWYSEAIQAGVHEPDAAVVSSIDGDGFPSSRLVLVREIDNEGFLFFTNYNSDKATSFAHTPKVSLTFGWFPLQRQVRIQGTIQKATSEESDAYFAGRPRGHQIGAWASPQSQIIDDREILLKRYEEIRDQFEGKDISRPENWGGYRITPTVIEFWQGKPDRLHDRFRYRRINDDWDIQRLAP